MKISPKLLLIPCLLPLIVVVIISSLNINKSVRIKLLTWTSPSLSLGIVMGIGGFTGALFAASTAISLPKQYINMSSNRNLPVDKNINLHGRSDLQSEAQEMLDLEYDQNEYVPERDIRDPSPTISVPFRVISTDGQRFSEPEYELPKNDFGDVDS